MPDLIAPTERLHDAWLKAHAEWGDGLHEDGFGLLPTDEVNSEAGFAVWVARLGEDSTHCTYRWIIEGDQVLGGTALRHEFNDFVQWAGHVGYGIRPSARRRGLATWALGRMVKEARVLGMDRLLIVCEAGNNASAKTIERQGGILEDDGDGKKVPRGATGYASLSRAPSSQAYLDPFSGVWPDILLPPCPDQYGESER